MKILPEIYADPSRPIYSFEVFPPKTEKGMFGLDRVLQDLVGLLPHFMTVTYGAMGTTRERTLEIAVKIRKSFNFETACHLTCVGVSRAELDNTLTRIRDAGIQNIVALRGDPPLGETEFKAPADGFSHARELVEHIRAFERKDGRGPFGIAVAGYPEKHPQAPDLETDLRFLKQKLDAGADIVVTQLFLDNHHYFEYVRKARALGINAPIVPGLLPMLSVNQIRKITSMCGVQIPEDLHRRLLAAGDNDSKAQLIGVERCVTQARELLENGAPGIHFYVLNKANHMKAIMAQLR